MLKNMLAKLAARLKEKRNSKGLPFFSLVHFRETFLDKLGDAARGAGGGIMFGVFTSLATLLLGGGVSFFLTGSFSNETLDLLAMNLGVLAAFGLVIFATIFAFYSPSEIYGGRLDPDFLSDGRKELYQIYKLIAQDPLKGDPESLAAAKSAAELWDSLALSYSSWIDSLDETQAKDLHQALKAANKVKTAIMVVRDDDGNIVAPILPSEEELLRQREILEILDPLKEQMGLITEVLNSLEVAKTNALEREALDQQSFLLSDLPAKFGTEILGKPLPVPAINAEVCTKLQSQIREITDVNLARSSAQSSLKKYINELS